jgi:predicted nucleic acid-binding protein
MKPYADTNFFTRVYLELPESEKADQLLEKAKTGDAEPLPITWLHRMELVNAFEISVWLSRQGGHPTVSQEQAAVAIATLRSDLKDGKFLRSVRPDTEKLESLFEETALRHTSKNGFRTYDILHVAAAVVLGCDTFFSFDLRAKKLAELEGLTVIE